MGFGLGASGRYLIEMGVGWSKCLSYYLLIYNVPRYGLNFLLELARGAPRYRVFVGLRSGCDEESGGCY